MLGITNAFKVLSILHLLQNKPKKDYRSIDKMLISGMQKEYFTAKVISRLRHDGAFKSRHKIICDLKKIGYEECFLILELENTNKQDVDSLIQKIENIERVRQVSILDFDKMQVLFVYKEPNQRDFIIRIISEMDNVKSIHILDVLKTDIKQPMILMM